MNKRAKARQVAQAAARERQLRQLRRQRRQRTVWISTVVVAALLLVGVIGAAVWQQSRPEDAAVPPSATVDGAGLPVGDGPVTVEVYLDLLCPACAAFDAAARPTLQRYLDAGTITLIYRPIAILDERTTTEYSTRAGAATGCAAEAGQVDEYVGVLLANQPAEDTAGLTDDQILALAAGAGVTSDSFGACTRDGTYRDWIGQNTQAAFDRGVQGTPTVFVAGERVEQPSVAALVSAVETAVPAA